MKQLIIFIISIVSMNIVQAQTDEAFLAEAFFGYMNEKSNKVYVEINCGLTWMGPASPESFYKTFREKFNITDTTIVDELYAYYDEHYNDPYYQKWNARAPLFQTPKYKQLKFVISKLAVRYERTRYISKPLFTKNREYALVSEDYCSYTKYNWRYRLKNGWKRKYECNVAGYNILFKKEDGRWVKVGQYLTQIS